MINFGLTGYHHYFIDRGWTTTIILLTILFLAFEIWMLVDVFNNRKVPKYHKLWWIVGMFIIHPFVALAYFFVTRFTDTYKN